MIPNKGKKIRRGKIPPPATKREKKQKERKLYSYLEDGIISVLKQKLYNLI